MPQTCVQTKIGPVLIESDGRTLTRIRIGEAGDPTDTGDALLDEAAAQIEAYFAGRRTGFDLPLAPAKTPRGDALRAAIAGIGHGETMTYGALAQRAGSSARAIGQACARNPFPIVVPCHRVTASGTIGPYSAGDGILTKRKLLAHESGDDIWAKPSG